jgi:hypothetical protein
MANAEVLRVTHKIDEKVQGVSVQVQGIDDNVKTVKENVQIIIDGAQSVLSYSPSLIFNRLDGKEAATEVRLEMRQIAYNVDDLKRSSSDLSSPTVKYLTRSQG